MFRVTSENFTIMDIFLITWRSAHSIQLPDTQNSPTENQRSVNLALETVLEFNNKDNSADIQFLDNVQNFITKVKTVIGRNKNLRRDFRAVENVENLTDFIQEFIAILNTYSDPEFLDAFDILDEEIRKYHYRGCKFYELTENYEIRKQLATKLDSVRGKPVHAIKSYINLLAKALKEEKYEKSMQDLLDYINSLYREDAREKFKKVLINFENLNKSKGKRSPTDMVKVIRDGIRSIIFDHYTNLNPNARRELKSKIETFWKQYNTGKYNEIPVAIAKISNVPEVDNVKTEIKIPENIDGDIKKAVSVEKIEPKPVVVKKEENKNTDHLRGEYKKNEPKRIEIKHSDYKIPGHMRDGIHGAKLKEKSNAHKPTYTHEDTGSIESADKDVTLTTSRKDHHIHHPTTKKASTNQLLRSFSTEEVISGESFEDNSIEFEQEELAQIENSPQRYITLYPETITFKQAVKKKPDKVIHRSKKIHTLPKFVTLWVEETTGRMPGAPREKLTSKTHQKPKKKPEHKSDRKKHKSGHKLKETLRHKARKHKKRLKFEKNHTKSKSNEKIKKEKNHTQLRTNEKMKKAVIFSENNAEIDVKVTAMEMYEYKKMMEPAKAVTKDESTSTFKTATTKNIKVTGGPVVKYVKRNQLLPQIKTRDFRKFVVPVRPSNGGRSMEQFERYKGRSSLRKNNKNDTMGTAVLDHNVINRIKDLERELTYVKNKMNDAKIDEINVLKDKYDKDKGKYEATAKKNTAPEELNLKKDQLKLNADNRIEYKTELKVASGKGTKFAEKKENMEAPERKDIAREEARTVDNKIDNNNGKDSKEKKTKYDAKESEVRNDKIAVEINRQKEKETKEDSKDKLVKEHKLPDLHATLRDFVENNVYDEVDEWKDAFQSRMKFTNTKGTSTTFKTTQAEVTTEATTAKPTEETTIPTKVEIFIPVSVPEEFMPSYKTSNVVRKDEGKNLNLEKESGDPVPNNPSQIQSTLTEAVSNVSNTVGNHKNIEKEVIYMFKMNNITIPKDKGGPTSPEAVGDPDALQAEFLNKIASPKANGNDSAASILFTDPFKGDDEMEFLKAF